MSSKKYKCPICYYSNNTKWVDHRVFDCLECGNSFTEEDSLKCTNVTFEEIQERLKNE